HNHTDHLDPDTLRPMLQHNVPCKLIVPSAWRLLAADRSRIPVADVIPINDGETRRVLSAEILAVPAAHDQIERDGEGNCKYLGYVIRLDRWTLYHSGDTVVYPGMVDRLRPWNIDIAILPINGKVGNMNGVDAARLAKDIGAKVVIP